MTFECLFEIIDLMKRATHPSFKLTQNNIFSSRNLPALFFFSLILISFSVIITFFFFRSKLNSQTSNQPISSPSFLPDEITLSKIYKSTKYNYSINYPENAQRITRNDEDIKIFIGSDEFSIGITVAIEILANPKKIPLAQLGNEKYGSGCGEITEDLSWKEKIFNGFNSITNTVPPSLCGDSGIKTIYLLDHQDKIFSISMEYIDQTNSTHFKDLGDEILSTFTFLD